MKLISITCPHCGARLQATPNAKMLTCDYCNGDFMLDDEVKRVRMVDAEQAGYEFEKGRRRAIKEADLAEKQAAMQAALEARRRKEEEERQASLLMWITCPNCSTDIQVEKELTTASCTYCGFSINVELGQNICWGREYLRTGNYKGALKYYLKAHKIDPGNKLVNWGLDYIKERYVHTFILVNVPHIFMKDETLAFRIDCLVYIKNSGKQEVYYYSEMQNIGRDDKSFWFNYPGNVRRLRFSTEAPDYVYKFLLNAKQGIYDRM